METNLDRKIALWLDHSQAHFIDLSKGPAIVETVYSSQESQVRFEGEGGRGIRLGNNRSTSNEHHEHNRERNHLKEYYEVLTDRLKGYDNIFLFGPTEAKDELFNLLKEEKNFGHKTISVQATDRLTENQMIAEAKKFFKL